MPPRPSQELAQFAVWTLDQTLERMGRAGKSVPPVLWSMKDGKQFAEIFDDGTDPEACRATISAGERTAERYAIVYEATFKGDDGTTSDALVAEVGDRTDEFHFGVLFDWTSHGDAKRPAPRGGQIMVSHLGTSKLA